MDSSGSGPRGLSRVHLIILAVMVLVAGLLAWTTWSARSLVQTFVPQIEAADRAAQRVTEAHLWLEEIVSGDASEDPAQVWERIAEARAGLEALERGGRPGVGGEVRPVQSAVAREGVVRALVVLGSLEDVARQRVAATGLSGVGSDVDARFDATYEEFVVLTGKLHAGLQQEIDAALRLFTAVQAGLIALVVALFGWVLYLLRRKEAMEQDAHLRSLQESFRQLESSRQELQRQNALRGALVELGERLQGLETEDGLARVALDMICARAGASAGACWRRRDDGCFERLAGHAVPPERMQVERLEPGEGLVGRAADEGRPVAIDLPADYFPIASGLGRAPAPHLRVLPMIHDGVPVAVLELAFLARPDADAEALLESAAAAVAIRLHLAGRRSRGG